MVLNSALVEQLDLDELRFVLAHELGHYQAKHTVLKTLLYPLGSNSVWSGIMFGIWSRKAEYSSDRCALVLTKDIDSGISSLIKIAIGKKLYSQLNISAYVEQAKSANTSDIKFSELLADHPFVTNRIKKLLEFWNESFKK